MRRTFAIALFLFLPTIVAAQSAPSADFLFVGSYHMANPGRDMNNTRSDDVLAPKRQREIEDVVAHLARYRPTRLMIEWPAEKQKALEERYAQTCAGKRPYGRGEEEQIAFRLACRLKLGPPIAVDWNETGPIKSEASVDFMTAVEKYKQTERRDALLSQGRAEQARDQKVLDTGSILDMLRRLNSKDWRTANARAYFGIAQFGTPQDPVGANWEALWYLRNRLIANNIERATRPGDRVLVLYGSGHGNWLIQNAAESGHYRMHEALEWLGAPKM